jgi:hypothetical protein
VVSLSWDGEPEATRDEQAVDQVEESA